MDELRRKLYDRGTAAQSIERHGLTDTPIDVSRNWDIPARGATPSPRQVSQIRPPQEEAPVVVQEPEEYAEPEPEQPNEVSTEPKKRRRYRSFILVASFLIFIFGVGLSSLYLYLGGNQISSDNISVSVTGPFTAGGGEVLDVVVTVVNDNAVPMESATLVVKYPPGTRSVGEAPRNLYEERIPVSAIDPGERQEIPLQIVAFGEEQAELQITATIEYRIQGSNSVFYKEAPAYAFSISSSPILLRVKNPEKVASGQAVTIEMTVVSNASTPQRDLLISASYPNGFRFESAEPSPVFGNNVWEIDELLPEESTTIRLTGVVGGLTEESFRINFDVGPAKPESPYIVGSLLTEASADFLIESPFIDVRTQINGESSGTVVLDQDQQSRVEVSITNTLDDTVYDMLVEVVPGGNALSETSIVGTNGFYDSNSGTIRWEVSNNSTFAEVEPGQSRSLTFTVSPNAPQATASYDLVVNVYARRISDSTAAEQLIGTARLEAKYASEVFLGSQAGHGGIFAGSGPIPPKVGEATTYTLTMVAEAGVNDLTDAVVTTGLPVYVDWLDNIQGEGDLIYNSVSKQLEWKVGNIISGARKEVSFQVSITPSVSQARRTPVLLQGQTLRTTDRFTGTRLQATADPVYTELSTEAGFSEDNGIVAQ